MDLTNIRNFKDFLQLYNKVTELCFSSCVDNFYSRNLSDIEQNCTEKCVEKFTNVNHKILGVYVQLQTEITNRRIAEYEAQQQQHQKLAQEAEKTRDLHSMSPETILGGATEPIPFIGLPASGKSTSAIELVKYCSNINFIYISYDIFQKKLNLNVIDYKSGAYKEFRAFMLKLINEIVATTRNSIDGFSNVKKLLMEHGIEWNYHYTVVGQSVICLLIDDNHYYRSMRYEIYQLAKRYRTGFLQIYFESTLESSIARNFKRCSKDQVPKEVLITMNNRLEPPNLNNLWEKYHCVVNLDKNDINFQNIYKLISQQTTNPEKPSEIRVIPLSKLHQIDLYLRKLISQQLRENDTIHHPNELNKKRKRILADLRAHIIEFPTNLDEIQEYFIFNK